jgi:hypothetical protein
LGHWEYAYLFFRCLFFGFDLFLNLGMGRKEGEDLYKGSRGISDDDTGKREVVYVHWNRGDVMGYI